jgi:hypothetical protein
MCRSIRVLFHFEPPATEDEIRAAALQYVRKVSGTRKPARANQARFDAAVETIAQVTRDLVLGLEPHGPPKRRELELVKAKKRFAARTARAVAPAASGSADGPSSETP